MLLVLLIMATFHVNFRQTLCGDLCQAPHLATAATVSEPLNSVLMLSTCFSKRDAQLSDSEKPLEYSKWLRT